MQNEDKFKVISKSLEAIVIESFNTGLEAAAQIVEEKQTIIGKHTKLPLSDVIKIIKDLKE